MQQIDPRHRELLSNIALFESLTSEDLDALTLRLEEVVFEEGQAIFQQGHRELAIDAMPSFLLPRKGRYEIFEPGQDIPIGFSLRRIGYPALEANCSLCHTGTYRTSPSDTPKVILGSPAHSLDLQSFQHFLFDCASDPRFTPSNVLKAINQVHQTSWFEGLVYRFLIIPVTKHGLLRQKIDYSWQDSRPMQGRGRVDIATA